MADHRQRAEALLAALGGTFTTREKVLAARPEVAAQMAIAHALLALGDQLDHDDELRWVAVEYANEEEPDA